MFTGRLNIALNGIHLQRLSKGVGMVEIKTKYGYAELPKKEYNRMIKPFIDFFEDNYGVFVKELFNELSIIPYIHKDEIVLTCYAENAEGGLWEKHFPLNDVFNFILTIAKDGHFGEKIEDLKASVKKLADDLNEISQ